MQEFLNNPIDISKDFYTLENEYYIPGRITSFDATKNQGSIRWNFHRYTLDWFFNKIDKHLQQLDDKGAPFQDYDVHPQCDFSVSFISSRTIRLRMKTTTARQAEHPSLMLTDRLPENNEWLPAVNDKMIRYQSEHGSVVINRSAFQFEVLDAGGKLLTGTQSMVELQAMHSKAIPFSFLRRTNDYSRSVAASFTLFPDERILGCGESFTSLNKKGQKLVLWAADAQSTASQQMYKPIPFFLSNRGYGMFVHTSSPCTFDFGFTQDGTKSLFVGEDQLDLFIFIGNPSEILTEYTSVTGKSPLPP